MEEQEAQCECKVKCRGRISHYGSRRLYVNMDENIFPNYFL